MNVTAFTDGACSGNPGPGGWAFLLTFGEHTLEKSGGIEQTGSNSAELTAVLEAVRAIKKPCTLTVVTDSTVVIGLLSQGWKRKNVALCDLCLKIETEAEQRGVVLSFVWTKGHASNAVHNRIDALARTEARKLKKRNALSGAQPGGSLPLAGG